MSALGEPGLIGLNEEHHLVVEDKLTAYLVSIDWPPCTPPPIETLFSPLFNTEHH